MNQYTPQELQCLKMFRDNDYISENFTKIGYII